MNMHAIFLNYMYEEESDENQNGFPGYFFIHLSNMSADFDDDDDDDDNNKLSLLLSMPWKNQAKLSKSLLAFITFISNPDWNQWPKMLVV